MNFYLTTQLSDINNKNRTDNTALKLSFICTERLPPLRELFPEIFEKETLVECNYSSNDADPIVKSLPEKALDTNYVQRTRRKSWQVTRNYTCTFIGCNKSYGTLNHLNTHVRTKQHGPKRLPEEFYELRMALKENLQFFSLH